MRPNPAETAAGVSRILRDTVLPQVEDPHAAAQLQQVIAVLGQTNWNEAAFQVMRAGMVTAEALRACADWRAGTPERASHFAVVEIPEQHQPESFDVALADLLSMRAALERFIGELTLWRTARGSADSESVVRVVSVALGG